MVRRHVTHVRHTLVDTGLDVDGQHATVDGECGSVDANVEQMRGDVESTAEFPVEQVDVEEKELTGQECIDQYPELWQQFNKLYDDMRTAVDQEAQGQGIPGEELNDEAEEEVEGDADRRVTRSISRKEALVGMLAMVSTDKLLRGRRNEHNK